MRARRFDVASGARAHLMVAILGAGSLALYAGLARSLAASGSYAYRPRDHLMQALALALLVLFYGLGYRCLRRAQYDRLLSAIVIVAASLFAVTCVMTAPFDSLDLYGYLNKGWEQFQYGLNPYSRTIDSLSNWRNDPMFTSLWLSNPCPYGFLFARVEWLAAALSGGNMADALLLFKLVNLGAFGLSGLLLFQTARLMRLARPELSLFLYLWNPALLLHEIANGHNDILVATFVVLAIFLWIRERWRLALAALTAAFLTKWVALVFIPFALMTVLRRRGWVEMLWGALGGAALSLAIAGRYLTGLGDFKLIAMVSNLVEKANSPAVALGAMLNVAAGYLPGLASFVGGAELIFGVSSWFVVGLLYAASLKALACEAVPDARSFVRWSLIGAILVICVGSGKFFGWYVFMFYPLALLLEEGDCLRRFTVALSVAELLHMTAVQYFAGFTYLLTTAIALMCSGWRVGDMLSLRRAPIPGVVPLPGHPLEQGDNPENPRRNEESLFNGLQVDAGMFCDNRK